jgi:hypothetical protein
VDGLPALSRRERVGAGKESLHLRGRALEAGATGILVIDPHGEPSRRLIRVLSWFISAD